MITNSRLGKCGRLGNQLWQYASTAGIAASLQQPCGFSQWDYRPFFNVPDEHFPQNIGPLVQAHETRLVAHMPPVAREYLQDYNLWSGIEEQVRTWFQPTEFVRHRILHERWFAELPRPILSLHVRLGDNLKQPNEFHPVRPMSYYDNALDQMEGEYESLVVFSDDPAWCRKNMKGIGADYFYEGVPRAKEHEKAYRTGPVLDWIDLHMMAMCDRHIIGNSTYAWWGAFLAGDKQPIYPMPWFGSGLDMIDASLMFPPGWIPIDHGQIR